MVTGTAPPAFPGYPDRSKRSEGSNSCSPHGDPFRWVSTSDFGILIFWRE